MANGTVQGLDSRSSPAGLRAVASFEAFKGLLVIALGLLVVAYHSRAEEVTENLLEHLHIDAEARFGHAVLHAAIQLGDARLWTILAAAFSYATVRFVEAWGLWNRRVWAEWFALLSGAMYLPLELFKVGQKATWDRIVIFVVNVMIVLYMLWIRLRASRQPAQP